MLAEAERDIPSVLPKDGIAQIIERAYVFGHYDSRGGTTMIKSNTLAAAAARYDTECGAYPDSPEEFADFATDDYIGCFKVVVYGTSLEAGEVMEFGGNCFRRIAQLQSRHQGGPWGNSNTLVLFEVPYNEEDEDTFYPSNFPAAVSEQADPGDEIDPQAPTLNPDTGRFPYEWRLIGRRVDDDAYGLIYMPEQA